jgi:hypothetical protein
MLVSIVSMVDGNGNTNYHDAEARHNLLACVGHFGRAVLFSTMEKMEGKKKEARWRGSKTVAICQARRRRSCLLRTIVVPVGRLVHA